MADVTMMKQRHGFLLKEEKGADVVSTFTALCHHGLNSLGRRELNVSLFYQNKRQKSLRRLPAVAQPVCFLECRLEWRTDY